MCAYWCSYEEETDSSDDELPAMGSILLQSTELEGPRTVQLHFRQTVTDLTHIIHHPIIKRRLCHLLQRTEREADQ